MDRDGLQVIFLTQAHHLIALRTAQLIRRPLARAGGKNLKSVATQPVGPFRSILDPTGGRCMNADAARGKTWRELWSGELEDVLLARDGTGHDRSIASEIGRRRAPSGSAWATRPLSG